MALLALLAALAAPSTARPHEDGHPDRVVIDTDMLLERHGLEDPAYRDGVRRLGLEIWERWSRTQLFVGEPSVW